MGAIVVSPLDRKGLLGTPEYLVVDGQQRLTTLQFLLSAVSIAMTALNADSHVKAIEPFIRNTNADQMLDRDVEIFKIWPTYHDRAFWLRASQARSFDQLRALFPDHFTQHGEIKKFGKHPPALEATWYFAKRAFQWAAGSETAADNLGDAEAQKAALNRLSELAAAILHDLVIISLVLEKDDDPQVIFETLNGHGAQLTATDLIRNFIFMRGERQKENVAVLFDERWARYDGPDWKVEEKRGRLKAKRMEWFLAAMIEAELRDDVELGRIYHEYQRFAGDSRVSDQLLRMNLHSGHYESLLTKDESPIGRFGWHLQDWDMTTVHPLALAICASNPNPDQQRAMFQLVESYIVRRAVCGMKSKNYNQVFIQVLKRLSGAAGARDATTITPETLRAELTSPTGEFARWPSDMEFERAFTSLRIFPGILTPAQMRAVLTGIENGLRSELSEQPNFTPIDGALDVDHMLPQEWMEHWPIGGALVTSAEIGEVRNAIPGTRLTERQERIARRDALGHTMGNLTLVHYGVNRSVKHYAFSIKKEKFINASNLHLNRDLMQASEWNEDLIQVRAARLLGAAKKVWPGPIRQ